MMSATRHFEKNEPCCTNLPHKNAVMNSLVTVCFLLTQVGRSQHLPRLAKAGERPRHIGVTRQYYLSIRWDSENHRGVRWLFDVSPLLLKSCTSIFSSSTIDNCRIGEPASTGGREIGEPASTGPNNEACPPV